MLTRKNLFFGRGLGERFWGTKSSSLNQRHMTTNIHPTAIIEKGAQLDEGVEVGAYAYIGGKVKIGRNTRIFHHATVDGLTELGENNEVHPYAFIGGKTNDLKYTGGNPGLKVGSRNVFREYVTVHAATEEGDFTIIGNDNLMLAYTHIAHQCKIGNSIIMSCYVGLSGHVEVDDFAVLGGQGGAHQFCKIGAYAMLGGCSYLKKDLPPYMIAEGIPAEVKAINMIGLKRRGFTETERTLVRRIHKLIYHEGLNRSQALEELKKLSESDPQHNHLFQRILQFASRSQKGLI